MTESSCGTPPLVGVKVVTLDRVFAGPFAGLILADLGAEVINVEPPGGDPLRARNRYGGHPAFNSVNRNRKSLVLDLKSTEGLGVFDDLIRDADVLIENMRPGVAERLKVGYDRIAELNEDIVYCSIKGFLDEDFDHLPSNDPAAQAMSGIMSMTGTPDSPPLRAGISITDFGAGMYAAIGILAALSMPPGHRGQKIDTGLFESGLSWMAYPLLQYQLTGVNPEPLGDGQPHYAPYGAYEAADGWVFIGVRTDQEWETFCECLGLYDLLDDSRFDNLSERLKHDGELDDILNDTFGEFAVSDLLEQLESTGIIFSRINNVADLVESGQLERNPVSTHFTSEVDEQDLSVPMTPIRSTSFQVTNRTNVKRLGSDTLEVLTEMGYQEDRIVELLEKGVIHADGERGK